MTRQEQFENFKHWVLRWHKALGLGDWRLTYFRLKDADEDGAPVARVWFDLSQKCAWLQFWGSDNPDVNISEFALHEVLHLLFAGREIPENEEHGIINRLLPVILHRREAGKI